MESFIIFIATDALGVNELLPQLFEFHSSFPHELLFFSLLSKVI